jgi:hypothetical protein
MQPDRGFRDFPQPTDKFQASASVRPQPLPSKSFPVHHSSIILLWMVYRRTSTYELSRNEQFVFTHIVRANELRLPIHLTHTEPHVYRHFSKLTLTSLTIYFMKK